MKRAPRHGERGYVSPQELAHLALIRRAHAPPARPARTSHHSGPYVPAPCFAGANTRHTRLLRAVEAAQRQRPSVRRRRLSTMFARAVRAAEKAGYTLTLPAARYTVNGYNPEPGDPRLSPAGNARRYSRYTAALNRSIAARLRGRPLRDGYLTYSNRRLLALRGAETRRLQAF